MADISFKGRHFQKDMILQSVRWYLAYSLSYRDIEELMQERGFSVDHSTINRWSFITLHNWKRPLDGRESEPVIGGEWMKRISK